MRGYDMVIMNVRSYTYPVAYRSAQIFKEENPNGLVLAGGMHATVALDEMLEVDAFDKICQGPGENIIVDLVRDPHVSQADELGVEVGGFRLRHLPPGQGLLGHQQVDFLARRVVGRHVVEVTVQACGGGDAFAAFGLALFRDHFTTGGVSKL